MKTILFSCIVVLAASALAATAKSVSYKSGPDTAFLDANLKP